MRSFFLSFVSGNYSYDLIPSRTGSFVVEWSDNIDEYHDILTSSEVNLDTLTRLAEGGYDYQLVTLSSRYNLTPKQALRLYRWIIS